MFSRLSCQGSENRSVSSLMSLRLTKALLKHCIFQLPDCTDNLSYIKALLVLGSSKLDTGQWESWPICGKNTTVDSLFFLQIYCIIFIMPYFLFVLTFKIFIVSWVSLIELVLLCAKCNTCSKQLNIRYTPSRILASKIIEVSSKGK